MSNLQNTQPEGFNRQTQVPTQTQHQDQHHKPNLIQQGIDKVSTVLLGKQPIIEDRPVVVGQQPITRTEKVVVGQQPIVEQRPVVVGQQPIVEQRPTVVGQQPVVEQRPTVVGHQPIIGQKDVVVGQQPIIEQRNVCVGQQPIIEQRPVVVGHQPIYEKRDFVVGHQPVIQKQQVVVGQQPVIEQRPTVVGQQPVVEQRPTVVGQQPIVEQRQFVVGHQPIMGEKQVVVGQQPIIEQRPAIIGEQILLEQRHTKPVFDQNLTTHLHQHQQPITNVGQQTITTQNTMNQGGVGVFTHGARLALLSSKDRFLAYNRNKNRVKHSKRRDTGEIWIVESLGNDLFALRNESDGRYLSCLDNKLSLNNTRSGNETWRVERVQQDGAWRYLLNSTNSGDFLSEGLLNLKLRDNTSSKTYWDAQPL